MQTSTDPADLGACHNCGAAAASCGECEHGPEQHDAQGYCRECERAEPDCRPCWAADAGERPRWTAPDLRVWERPSRSYYDPPDYNERQFCWQCDALDHEGTQDYDPTDDAERERDRH